MYIFCICSGKYVCVCVCTGAVVIPQGEWDSVELSLVWAERLAHVLDATAGSPEGSPYFPIT